MNYFEISSDRNALNHALC